MLAEDAGHGNGRVRLGPDRLDLAPRGHLSDYPAVVAAMGRVVGDLAGAVAPAVPAGKR
jgi:hypothetical protein